MLLSLSAFLLMFAAYTVEFAAFADLDASFSTSAVEMDFRSYSSSTIGVLNYPSAISLEHSILLMSKSLFLICSEGPQVYNPDLISSFAIYVFESFSILYLNRGNF